MQALAPLRAEAGIDIRLPTPESMPDPLLALEAITAGYRAAGQPDKTILPDVTIMVRGGSRIGILGVNGAGKSTMVKTLAGEQEQQVGKRRASQVLPTGYLAQQQIQTMV